MDELKQLLCDLQNIQPLTNESIEAIRTEVQQNAEMQRLNREISQLKLIQNIFEGKRK